MYVMCCKRVEIIDVGEGGDVLVGLRNATAQGKVRLKLMKGS